MNRNSGSHYSLCFVTAGDTFLCCNVFRCGYEYILAHQMSHRSKKHLYVLEFQFLLLDLSPFHCDVLLDSSFVLWEGKQTDICVLCTFYNMETIPPVVFSR